LPRESPGRINWILVPGMPAGALYPLEVPTSSTAGCQLRYLRGPAAQRRMLRGDVHRLERQRADHVQRIIGWSCVPKTIEGLDASVYFPRAHKVRCPQR